MPKDSKLCYRRDDCSILALRPHPSVEACQKDYYALAFQGITPYKLETGFIKRSQGGRVKMYLTTVMNKQQSLGHIRGVEACQRGEE